MPNAIINIVYCIVYCTLHIYIYIIYKYIYIYVVPPPHVQRFCADDNVNVHDSGARRLSASHALRWSRWAASRPYWGNQHCCPISILIPLFFPIKWPLVSVTYTSYYQAISIPLILIATVSKCWKSNHWWHHLMQYNQTFMPLVMISCPQCY